MLSFYLRDVLDEIWDLIDSVSEGFLATLKLVSKGIGVLSFIIILVIYKYKNR